MSGLTGDAWDRCQAVEAYMSGQEVTSSQIDLRNVIVSVVEDVCDGRTEQEQDDIARLAFNHYCANGGVEYDVQVGELLYSTVRDAVQDALERDGFTAEPEAPSPFAVVGTGTYDADSDSLATAPAGWYVEIVRDEPFENILIGPFGTADEAEEHCESTDVEDWVTGEAKDKGYVVDDVKVVENPTLIPSYGVNAPVFPVYAEGAALGILPGTEN